MSSRPQAEARVIEQDIRHTQDEMGDTVQKLEERLSPAGVAQSMIGDNREAAKRVLQFTKEHPIPVALIAVGVIGLVAWSGMQSSKQTSSRSAARRRLRPVRQARRRGRAPNAVAA